MLSGKSVKKSLPGFFSPQRNVLPPSPPPLPISFFSTSYFNFSSSSSAFSFSPLSPPRPLPPPPALPPPSCRKVFISSSLPLCLCVFLFLFQLRSSFKQAFSKKKSPKSASSHSDIEEMTDSSLPASPKLSHNGTAASSLMLRSTHSSSL